MKELILIITHTNGRSVSCRTRRKTQLQVSLERSEKKKFLSHGIDLDKSEVAMVMHQITGKNRYLTPVISQGRTKQSDSHFAFLFVTG